jgi:hypothetical protein
VSDAAIAKGLENLIQQLIKSEKKRQKNGVHPRTRAVARLAREMGIKPIHLTELHKVPQQKPKKPSLKIHAWGKRLPDATCLKISKPHDNHRNLLRMTGYLLVLLERDMRAHTDGLIIDKWIAQLNAMRELSGQLRPAHVCPYCKGDETINCRGCTNRRYITESDLRLVPEAYLKDGDLKFNPEDTGDVAETNDNDRGF